MIKIVRGDITQQTTAAIVNAANTHLIAGSGVCGEIHGVAGPDLESACRAIGSCPTGDARIADMHMAMGDVAPYGPPFAIVPGDGGASLIPLYMAPPLAKKYLMLGKEYSARKLADLHLINYAVPADKLDAEVDRLVAKLLEKPPLALAWTKRTVNRYVAAQHNQTLDTGAAAYEMVNFLQWERQGFEQDMDFE
jgi:hypothetical protein